MRSSSPERWSTPYRPLLSLGRVEKDRELAKRASTGAVGVLPGARPPWLPQSALMREASDHGFTPESVRSAEGRPARVVKSMLADLTCGSPLPRRPPSVVAGSAERPFRASRHLWGGLLRTALVTP